MLIKTKRFCPYQQRALNKELISLCLKKTTTLNEIQNILANGADINARWEFGETPLHFALCNNLDISIINYMMNYPGVNLKAKCILGVSILHRVIEHDHYEFLFDELQKRELDLHETTKSGSNLVHLISMSSNCDTGRISFLKKNGFDLKQKTGNRDAKWLASEKCPKNVAFFL